MRHILIISLPVILFLSGCTKMMNENQCLVADWRTVGYEDGSQGRDQQWLSRRSEACAEFGVTPDLDQYLFGRSQGLEVYCQPRRGFSLGLRGTVYENVCPTGLEGSFLAGYQDGLGLRDRENHYNELENRIGASFAELEDLDHGIEANTITLATGNMTTEERIAYAIDLKNMAEDRGRLSEIIPQLEAERDASRYDLDAYRASIAPKYPGAL